MKHAKVILKFIENHFSYHDFRNKAAFLGTKMDHVLFLEVDLMLTE